MGAWKSSDGGSISQVGGSSATGSYTTTTTIVAAGANVRGVIVRTCSMRGVGASAEGYLTADGVRLAGLLTNTFFNLTREIFIPSGQALAVERVAGTLDTHITYDIL
ncbi:MAG: hypothetical protein RLO08_00295 [Parvibaculaceae bacterium]